MTFLNFSILDFVKPYQIGFQTPATPMMEAIIKLHNHVMFYLTVIIFLTFAILIYILCRQTISKNPHKQFKQIKQFSKKQIRHHGLLEFIWTVLPTIVLFFVSGPSFTLMHAAEVEYVPYMTINVVGHQWYWSYEYTLPSFIISNPDIQEFNINFDSYMIATEDLKPGQLRLLSTDNPVWIPLKKEVRVEITSSDVLHSWAVPSLGVKVDAVPGRDNEVLVYMIRSGTYFGQCSELCGVNHGFMPIEINGAKFEEFNCWVYLTDEGWDMIRREMSFAVIIIFPNFDYQYFQRFPVEYTRGIREGFFEDGEHRIVENFFLDLFIECWEKYPYYQKR
jgi:cytochrome c oxidase subunit II